MKDGSRRESLRAEERCVYEPYARPEDLTTCPVQNSAFVLRRNKGKNISLRKKNKLVNLSRCLPLILCSVVTRYSNPTLGLTVQLSQRRLIYIFQ